MSSVLNLLDCSSFCFYNTLVDIGWMYKVQLNKNVNCLFFIYFDSSDHIIDTANI